MRIFVLGGNGMLGHQLCSILSNRFEVFASIRKLDSAKLKYLNIGPEQIFEQITINNLSKIEKIISELHPDVVINAIGVVKQRNEIKDTVNSISVNSLFPHQLANICEKSNTRLIQISTDCVFSGNRGNYSESDIPDPTDLYGRTKLLGEIIRPNCLTIRTSIIGWEINHFSSLLGWFAQQRHKTIKGYRKAIYSGLTTKVLAELLGDIVSTRTDLTGLFHVSSAPISKYELLTKLRDYLGWSDINIESDERFFCDRSLESNRFSAITGWRSPTWENMLIDLSNSWQKYQKLYKKYLQEP